VSNVKLQSRESAEIITKLFPDSVSGLILPINDYTSHLSPNEYEIIRKASDKRKFEFSTGRWCAKQILKQKDIKNFPILSGENREPIWPEGIIGSISHCKDQCGAVIASKSNFSSIGFDIENIRNVKEKITDYICTDEENKWLNSQAQSLRTKLILLIFSIKESLYKCQYMRNGTKNSFIDYSLIPNLQEKTATLSKNSKNKIEDISIRFNIIQDHVCSGVTLKN